MHIFLLQFIDTVLLYCGMSVEFDKINRPQRIEPENSKGPITNLVLKLGLAKDASQANVVLLIIAVSAVILSIYLIVF